MTVDAMFFYSDGYAGIGSACDERRNAGGVLSEPFWFLRQTYASSNNEPKDSKALISSGMPRDGIPSMITAVMVVSPPFQLEYSRDF